MTFDAMTDSYLFQLKRYFHSQPYRVHATNRPHIALSAHSNRLNKPSAIIFDEFINNQTNPISLDRMNYKLRIKSDMNVDTLRDTHRHGRNPANSNLNDPLNPTPRPITTKTLPRQPTSVTRTTTSKKTILNKQFNGIEGNAVRVGTLNDLIKHFHQEEIRLIHHPTEYLENVSNNTPNNQLTNEHPTPKSPHFLPERVLKQPQALTEYHFSVPNSPRTTTYQNRLKDERNNIPNHPQLTDEYLMKRKSLAMTSRDKRIQESRAKTLFHTEKQLCICNKLTIMDPFNSESTQSTFPSAGYLFPPVRPFGYLTKKSIEDISQLTPLVIRKKYQTKKRAKGSVDSIDKISSNVDENSQLLSDTTKSMTTLTDLDELENPPNTTVNLILKH